MRKNCENSQVLDPKFSGQTSMFRFDLSWMRSAKEDLQVKRPNIPKNRAIFVCEEHHKMVLLLDPPPKKNTFLSGETYVCSISV